MLVCVYGAYLIVGSKFNDRVVLIWKYIYMGIYIWKYLACNVEPRFSFLLVQLWGWAEMKFLCRYATTKHVARLVTFIYDRTYVCHRVCR